MCSNVKILKLANQPTLRAISIIFFIIQNIHVIYPSIDVLIFLYCSKRVDDGNMRKVDWKDHYLQILIKPR